MKKNVFEVVIFVWMNTIPQFASATLPFTMGEPVIEGNGCPSGSYEVMLNPDGSELALFFSEFTAMTDATHDYDFSNCNIAIPIDLPNGIMVGLVGIDYRGLAFIPSGGTGVLSREHFFAGTHSPSLVSSISVYDQFQPFLFEDEFPFVAWTKCGEDVIVRSNSTIMVTKSPTSSRDALMGVFSEYWDVSILFHLVWKYC
jgi:hypothetical protein